MAELPFMYGALVGTAALVTALFLWNLACAPFRIERDAKDKAVAELEGIKAQISQYPEARRLNSDQKVSLADVIRSAADRPDEITVFYDNTERECADLAVDIADAIEQTGTKAPVSISFSGPDARARGVKVEYGEKSESAVLASEVRDELKSFGIGVQKISVPDSERTLYIYVYRSGQSD